MATPRTKKNRASGTHGRTVLRSAGVRPGRDERPDLVEQDGHRQDDPDDQGDLDLDDERVADAEDLQVDAVERRLEELPDVRREVEAERRADRDGDDRAEQPRPQLAEMVDERHDRLVAGRGGRRR